METQSQQRYRQYMQCKEGLATIRLKSGRILNGFVAGYFKNEYNTGHPSISTWHIVCSHGQTYFGIGDFTIQAGEMIDDDDIETIQFN
jgi:hypothetical protein